ncbi:MAG: 6-bladed beta-propeller [Candidatus Aminicenantales bacterium]
MADNELIEVNLKLKGYFPSSDPEKDGLIFRQLSSIASDIDGRVALLDMGECRVYLFSPSGKLISSFGRRGQGPGEFSFPMKVGFYKDLIYVFSTGDRRLQFFKD